MKTFLILCMVAVLSAAVPADPGGWLPMQPGPGDSWVFEIDGEEQLPDIRVTVFGSLAGVEVVDPNSGQGIPLTVVPVALLDTHPNASELTFVGTVGCWLAPVSTPDGPGYVLLTDIMSPGHGDTLSEAVGNFQAGVADKLAKGWKKTHCP